MAKKAYSHGKRGLFTWQKRPIHVQKRPIHMAKETYLGSTDARSTCSSAAAKSHTSVQIPSSQSSLHNRKYDDDDGDDDDDCDDDNNNRRTITSVHYKACI